MTPSEASIKEVIEKAGRVLSRNTIAAVVYATYKQDVQHAYLDFTEEEIAMIDFLSIDRLVEAFSSALPCFDMWATPTSEEFDRFERL